MHLNAPRQYKVGVGKEVGVTGTKKSLHQVGNLDDTEQTSQEPILLSKRVWKFTTVKSFREG